MNNSFDVNMDLSQGTAHSLMLIGGGEEECTPKHTWGPGVRPHYLIHYVISGKGTFYYGPNKFTVQQGQIFVIFPETIIKYQADGKNPWHYIWINFHGEAVEEIFSQLEISYNSPIFTVKNGTKLLEVMRSMHLQTNTDLCTNLKLSARLYDFMALLAENKDDSDSSENVYLQTATRYINAHYFEDISVEQIAAHVGISRKYLFAIFKRTLNISPKDYIINYRLKQACSFLENQDLPIGNIAYSVGYKDPLTFSKMFKKKTGLSPSEYRAQKL